MKYAALLVLAIFALGCTAQSNADVTVNTPGVAIDMDVGGAPSGEVREFDVVARTWTWEPSTITVKEGDTVKLHITSVDVPHGFRLAEFDVNEYLAPGSTVDVEFVADKKGSYTFYCNVQCGEGHKGMKGQFIVE
ncbi:cupredoxin domain-containing protein [Candidatus Woesearchaeota archaeon]|nr:cupredoxin domain-containing protein [Candidatus Woesearchaeota archaeon]